MDFNDYDIASTTEIVVQSENEQIVFEQLKSIDEMGICNVRVIPARALHEHIKSSLKSSAIESICIILEDTTQKNQLMEFIRNTFNVGKNISTVNRKHVEILIWHNNVGEEGFYKMLYAGIVDNALSQVVKAVVEYNRNKNIVQYTPDLDKYVTLQTYLLWQRNPLNSLQSAIDNNNIDLNKLFVAERKIIKKITVQ